MDGYENFLLGFDCIFDYGKVEGMNAR